MYAFKVNKLSSPLPINGEWGNDYTNLSSSLHSWLFDPSSLTARLKANCRQFRVDVIFEQSVVASQLTEHIGATMVAQDYWLRQVVLMCDGIPWVFASTVIPNTTITAGHQFLSHLGSQPLGEALFNNSAVSRGNIEIKAFEPSSHPLPDLLAQALTYTCESNDTLWGRRSIFSLDSSPLMVSEIFLPACIAYHA